MKIALISFEYPPDAAYGGIGTYIYQVARLMNSLGHHVEVFSASPKREGTFECDGILTHLVKEGSRMFFHSDVGPLFAKRHREVGFDVLEGAEYYYEGLEASRLAPDVAVVAKLHSPNLLLREIDNRLQDTFWGDLCSYFSQVRSFLGAIRHGRDLPRFHWSNYERNYAKDIDSIEREFAKRANLVVSPSLDLLKKQIEAWALNPAVCDVVPNPFNPTPELLLLPTEHENKVITFMGRLEVRKGILELADALPQVLEQFPDWKVCFAGRSASWVELELRGRLKNHLESVEFLGGYTSADLPAILGRTAIGIFPSIWENFPNVCLEAMSAGRAVIGSAAGGMAEMISDGVSGRLVPPKNADAIASTLAELIRQPALRARLGAAARETVLARYGPAVMGPAIEKSYKKAIENKRLGVTA